MSKKTKKINVDKNMKDLEKIVEEFEDGDIGVEEGIRRYEQAAKLIKEIKKELKNKDLKIEEIRESYED